MKTSLMIVAFIGAATLAFGGMGPGSKETKGVKVTSPDAVVVKQVMPVFPREMARTGSEGLVKVSLTIDASGNVVSSRVLTAEGTEFAKAAEAAVRQWKFETRGEPGADGNWRATVQFRFALLGT